MIFIDSGVSAFINHGYNATSNMGDLGIGFETTDNGYGFLNENAVDLDAGDIMHQFFESLNIYNPLIYRHLF